jgi:cell division protein FtsX
MTARIRTWLLAAVAIVFAAAVPTFLQVSQVTAVPVEGSPKPPCFIDMYLKTDDEMRQLAGKLRDDQRVGELTTETKQQAYERFKRIFADQPDLANSSSPETMPAAVRLSPAEGTSKEELIGQLTAEHPEAEVRGYTLC